MLATWKESYDTFRHHIIKLRHHDADKDPYSQSYVFSSSHVYMTVGSCTIKKAEHLRIDVFEL